MDRAPSMEGQGNWKGDPGKMQHKRYKKLKKKKAVQWETRETENPLLRG